MNRLYRMTKEEFEKKKILYKYPDTKYIIMDGAGIETYAQYFDRLWEVFGFSDIPEGWKKDFHTEDDFMTEMDELPEDKYVFVIMLAFKNIKKSFCSFFTKSKLSNP